MLLIWCAGWIPQPAAAAASTVGATARAAVAAACAPTDTLAPLARRHQRHPQPAAPPSIAAITDTASMACVCVSMDTQAPAARSQGTLVLESIAAVAGHAAMDIASARAGTPDPPAPIHRLEHRVVRLLRRLA